MESLAEAFAMLCLNAPPEVSVEAGMVAHTSKDLLSDGVVGSLSPCLDAVSEKRVSGGGER